MRDENVYGSDYEDDESVRDGSNQGSDESVHDGSNQGSIEDTTSTHKAFRKKPWTKSEDELLKSMVESHGARDWNKIALQLQGRSAKQCCERWHNYLKPNIRRDAWRPDEDHLIMKFHMLFCNKWTKIAAFLPGRTGNSVKNRYYCLVRRDKRKKEKGEAPYEHYIPPDPLYCDPIDTNIVPPQMVMYDTSQQVINTGGPGMVTPCRTSQVVQAHTGDLWGELERGGAEFQMDMENRMGMENLDHVKRGQFMEAPKDQPQQMFTPHAFQQTNLQPAPTFDLNTLSYPSTGYQHLQPMAINTQPSHAPLATEHQMDPSLSLSQPPPRYLYPLQCPVTHQAPVKLSPLGMEPLPSPPLLQPTAPLPPAAPPQQYIAPSPPPSALPPVPWPPRS